MSREEMVKNTFDINVVMKRVGNVVKVFPKAALFELADQGFQTPFEQLVACMISIRTLDEVTLRLAPKLFARARTPEEVSLLSVGEIRKLINGCTFHERKADQLLQIARFLVEDYQGQLPCDKDMILSLPGVGIKCANLILGIACGEQAISVDVHVHRITLRWGYIHASTPEKATIELEKLLPERYWLDINRFLVPFGKHVCTGNLPHCSTCPVLDMCQQVGVEAHR